MQRSLVLICRQFVLPHSASLCNCIHAASVTYDIVFISVTNFTLVQLSVLSSFLRTQVIYCVPNI